MRARAGLWVLSQLRFQDGDWLNPPVLAFALSLPLRQNFHGQQSGLRSGQVPMSLPQYQSGACEVRRCINLSVRNFMVICGIDVLKATIHMHYQNKAFIDNINNQKEWSL